MKTIEDRAHDYMCNLILKGFPLNEVDIMAERCFKLAEAMQAESEKRKTTPNARSLTKDEHGNCLHFHHEFGHKNCMDCGASLKNWQPDWSQAPDGFNWWAADDWGYYWYDQEPKWIDDEWGGYIMNKNNRSATEEAPSFNYQGNWKDSLRKRP